MKKCSQEGCNAQIQDAYTFCMTHYKKPQDTGKRGEGMWHEDPVVDQLMKLNSNLGSISKAIKLLVGTKAAQRITEEIEGVRDGDKAQIQ